MWVLGLGASRFLKSSWRSRKSLQSKGCACLGKAVFTHRWEARRIVTTSPILSGAISDGALDCGFPGKLCGNSSISTHFWIIKCVQESAQVCVDLLGSWVRALSSDSLGMWESYVETWVFPRISGLLNVYKSPTKSVWICLVLGFELCPPTLQNYWISFWKSKLFL